MQRAYVVIDILFDCTIASLPLKSQKSTTVCLFVRVLFIYVTSKHLNVTVITGINIDQLFTPYRDFFSLP